MTRKQIHRLFRTDDDDFAHGGKIRNYTIVSPKDGEFSPYGLPENPSAADVFELSEEGYNYLFKKMKKHKAETRDNLTLVIALVAAIAAVASVLLHVFTL